MSLCGRCKHSIKLGDEHTCWFCIDWLCGDCWDEVGHCGHPEAEAINERARKVRQPGEAEGPSKTAPSGEVSETNPEPAKAGGAP